MIYEKYHIVKSEIVRWAGGKKIHEQLEEAIRVYDKLPARHRGDPGAQSVVSGIVKPQLI
jgi:hypothetical protein